MVVQHITQGAKDDPRRINWPEKDRERLTGSEFEGMENALGAIYFLACASDRMQKRLESVPHGKQRMALALGAVRSISEDLLGTVPEKQRNQIRHTLQDMAFRMVPKLTPLSKSVLIDYEILKGILNVAHEKCTACVEDNESCRQCPLYQHLEAVAPLKSYDTGMACPYSVADWED